MGIYGISSTEFGDYSWTHGQRSGTKKKSGGFWIILDHEIVVTVIQMIQCHWDKIGICLGYITIYLQHHGDDPWECRFDHRASHARVRFEFVQNVSLIITQICLTPAYEEYWGIIQEKNVNSVGKGWWACPTIGVYPTCRLLLRTW